jgi:flagellar hook-basal body complex protein FliE
MTNMSVDSVLAQIRAMSAQVKPVASPHIDPASTRVAPEKSSFASLMAQSLDQVNQTQQNATDLATKFEKGVPGVELADVMIEMQKASVSFRGVTEVRNRMVSAYQDIMNMQI